MSVRRLRTVARRRASVVLPLLAVLAVLPACGAKTLRPERYAGRPDELFTAGVRELRAKRWDNAVAAFEKLTTDLAQRDTLLPRAHLLLGDARTGRQEHLLAAQSYSRLAEGWPEDTLAPEALLRSARSYQKLWRSPEHDAGYGQTAQATFRTLMAVYPDARQVKDAQRELATLDQWFASKEYLTGYYYLRRKAYDPAIIYFKSVITNHPETPRVRDAYLRLVESYRAIRYAEEATEACTALRGKFAQDAEVRRVCPAPPATPAARPVAAPAARPDSGSARIVPADAASAPPRGA
ncbi:MAG: outer membrane protein assembly factor BamD [Gemmatimonadaceae bacterium]|nr:outer membrane protein assembly factor BamD [Gemmatimonadaceae bacterium]